MEWIAVSDGLPKRSEYVIATDGLTAFVAYWDDPWWRSIPGDEIDDVTHWMPLPPPPGK